MTTAKIIDEIASRLERAVPPGSRVILFGSQARGKSDDRSDFDVLVIEPDVANCAAESVRLRRELRGLLVPIDVVVLDGEDARIHGAVPGTMVDRAMREGRVLAST